LNVRSKFAHRPLRIGIVGCGAIGSQLARYIARDLRGCALLVGLHDLVLPRAMRLSRQFRPAPAVLPLAMLVRRSQLIVEAASAAAVLPLAQQVVAHGKDMMVMSSGGVLRHPAVLASLARHRCRLYLPSGALVGLDGVKAAAIGRIRRIVLTTRKPPASLAGSPGALQSGIALSRLKRPAVIFEGSPVDAVRLFPHNINVCATLALAAGRRPVIVRIVAEPGLQRNVHELEVVGDAGTFRTLTENVPDEANPRTSRLAILSATACLQSLVGYVRIGT